MITDNQPCALRYALSEGKQKISFLQTAEPHYSRSFKSIIDDPSLEIVVIDCIFNDHNGLNRLDEIKKHRPDVPVIYIGAADHNHVVSEALKRGARDVVKRPVDVLRFKDRIDALQKLKSASRERRTPLRLAESRLRAFPRTTVDAPDTVLRTINYIEEHFYAPRISISTLAGIAGMSPFHFCRVFKKHVSVTPMQFVALVRVEKAKNLLKNSPENTSVSSIANATGFYDSSNFNKHFKKITGLTPTGFRRSFRSDTVKQHFLRNPGL